MKKLAAFSVAAVLLTACSDVTGLREQETSRISGPAETVPASFPRLARPGKVYVAPVDLYDEYFTYHHGPLSSRYVLYDDGTFSLQFLSNRFGFFEYLGRHTLEGATLKLLFSDDPRWDAVATLEAGRLTVQYNVIMMLSDFVDGVYELAE